jgi:COP9 signalosome complex subunit 7
MPTVRELEDLIIDAIYLDILRGRLDQKQEQLEVEYTMGRDLAPGAVDAVLAALRDWCVLSPSPRLPLHLILFLFNRLTPRRASTTASVLSTLDAKLAAVAAQAASHKDHLAAHDAALQSALLAAAKDKNSKRGALGMAYGGNVLHDRDAMDVDSEPGLIDRMLGRGEQENVKGKGRKCVHSHPFASSVLTILPQTHP